MKLTPLDIRKQNFRKTMRGFDPEDVRVFLDLIADEYEQLLQENGMLSEKVRHLSDQIERYHSMEKTLQNSLLTAERVSEEARERARLEAEAVVADARQRGERILGDSRDRLRELSRQVQELHREKDLFLQRFVSFLEGEMQFLRTHENELHEIDAIDTRANDFLATAARKPRPAEHYGYGPEQDDPAVSGVAESADPAGQAWPEQGPQGAQMPPSAPMAAALGRTGVPERPPLKDRPVLSSRPQPERFPPAPSREGDEIEPQGEDERAGFFAGRKQAPHGFFDPRRPEADS